MPGQKKRVWRGELAPVADFTVSDVAAARVYLPVLLPDNEPGREILIAIDKADAVELGAALWQWGNL